MWSQLAFLQVGKYAEYYTKMVFTSYGFDVYTSEVDDHGVDFVVKNKAGKFYEVQVKSMRSPTSYVFVSKSKIKIDDAHLVCLVRFVDEKLPEMYVFRATVWNTPNAVFVDRKYDKGQKSKPEWGINYSAKNLPLLEPYTGENMLRELLVSM